MRLDATEVRGVKILPHGPPKTWGNPATYEKNDAAEL